MTYEPNSAETRSTNPLIRLITLQLPLWLVMPLLALTVIISVGGGLLAGSLLFDNQATCPESEEICEDFAVFWEAWNLARQRYVDPSAAVPDQMIAGAVQGMLDTLGDGNHTRYLTAEDAERWEESLSAAFEGIGAYVDVRDDRALIVAPIPGSPADEAGLQSEDLIIAVDGESTEGWTIEELVTEVRGPDGTDVVLTIEREGEDVPFDVSITRSRVEIPSVSWSMLPDDVALVRLNSFSQRSGDELRTALTEAQDAGARAVLFDLRGNPGGLVNEALMVASQFLPANTPVLIEEERSGERVVTESQAGGVALEIPLVVLVDEFSASSSEIVAGALQDADRAEVVGVPTVGTGTVLTPFILDDGSRLLLGTSQWLTPDGRLIRAEGIEPDVIIDLPPEVRRLLPNEAGELSREELLDNEDSQIVTGYELLETTATR
jgi:carboxyl-terminal processing protease